MAYDACHSHRSVASRPTAHTVTSEKQRAPARPAYCDRKGRSAVCGKHPAPAQKALVESCARLVDDMVKAVSPGITARELGLRWAGIARKGGFDEGAGDDLFGHGLSTSFPSYVLPMVDADVPPYGYKRLKGPLKPGMVLAAEAFQRRKGVGAVGFEDNFIVTDTGAAVLDKAPHLHVFPPRILSSQ
jgi:Xaa-Pro aminopeptidase